ncbi:YcxB family protein [Nonomuraea sp. NPDC048826]|uniref:YcxB family protein n=1 Tax=Nonomuraea sp. NPDC048826 TaxID=3364347 RepID=UPI003722B3B2
MMARLTDEGGPVDITVTYEPTPDEVARALDQGVRHQLRVMVVVASSFLVVAGLVCLLLGGTGAGVALLAGAAVFPLAMTWSIRRTGRRQFAHLCVPTTLRLTDDGYEAETEASLMRMRWATFGRIVTGPEFWLFYVNKQFTGFLPRRAFTGDQQAEFDRFVAARTA